MGFHMVRCTAFAVLALVSLTTSTLVVGADLDEEQLAKLAQNPVGNLISVPFQNNTNLNVGPEKGTQNILNVQPVVPFSLDSDWNIITRTILPFIWNPALGPGIGSTSGMGDTVITAFLSPARPGTVLWGIGPVVQVPTHSNAALGNDNWGAGPSAVVLHLAPGDPWVYGVLVNNVWSVTSDKAGGSYSNGIIQPFLNYNIEPGLYVTSAPLLTVNWKATSSQRWTVPIGGGIGRIFHLGRLPVNAQLSAYYNAIRPDSAANWQVRAQVQLMFPK